MALLMLSAAVLASCANVNQAIWDNISEVYHGVYEGSSDKASLKVITGVREKNFVMDGISGSTADFTVITLTPAAGFTVAEGGKYAYTFTFNEKPYEGEFAEDKVSGKPAAEIKLNMGNGGDVTVTVTAGETSTEVTVKSVMGADIIPYTAALDLAKQEFKAEIEALFSGGKLNCEIYIRYVAGSDTAANDYYWYVAFLQSDKKFFAALIDPNTSAILAKRTQ